MDLLGPCTNVFLTAYAHVRTEPQCDIGQTRGKKRGRKVFLLRGLSENKVVDFFAEKFVEAEAAIQRTNPKSKIGVSCLAHGRGLMKKFQSCLTQSSEFKCNALDCKRSFSSGGWTGFCLICSLHNDPPACPKHHFHLSLSPLPNPTT